MLKILLLLIKTVVEYKIQYHHKKKIKILYKNLNLKLKNFRKKLFKIQNLFQNKIHNHHKILI